MTGDRLTAAQRRHHGTEGTGKSRTWVGSLGDRLNRLVKAHNNTIRVYGGNFAQHERDLALLRDRIEVAKHYHDHRIDEIWTLLVRAGILPTEALHETVRDNSDVWGRVEGCDHCAPALERHPFEGSVLAQIEARDAERERLSRAFVDEPEDEE